VAGSHKQSAYRQGRAVVSLYLAEVEPFDRIIAQDVLDNGIPHKVDLRMGQGAVLHDLGGAQCVAAVNHVDPCGETRQKERFLHRRIAATHDGNLLSAEKSAITGRAGRHPTPHESLFVSQPKVLCRSAGRNNDGTCQDGVVIVHQQAKGSPREIHRRDSVSDTPMPSKADRSGVACRRAVLRSIMRDVLPYIR
jgi:hypothetical protein